MAGRRPLQQGHALIGEYGEDRTIVTGTGAPVHQPGLLHLPDLISQPALGVDQDTGQFSHPHLPVGGPTVPSEDLVLQAGQAEITLEPLLQLPVQQRVRGGEGRPGTLLLVIQPTRMTHATPLLAELAASASSRRASAGPCRSQ
jgi:hypothetical protein